MPSLTDTEKAEFIEEVRRAILRDDELICRLREQLQRPSASDSSFWLANPVEILARRYVDQLRGEAAGGVTVNYWSYALLMGVIGLAGAAEPGGLSELQGFALGFGLTFLGLLGLELLARRRGVMP
jgi:hypothetical protein